MILRKIRFRLSVVDTVFEVKNKALTLLVMSLLGCSSARRSALVEGDSRAAEPHSPPPAITAVPSREEANDAGAPAVEHYPEQEDPMDLHKVSRDELLSLFAIRPAKNGDPRLASEEPMLRALFGVDGPAKINQGNRELAYHAIGKEACLKGLRDVVIQTAEQKSTCGAENMVPIFKKNEAAHYCIDVFEFPNRACELPMVWVSPASAKNVCEIQGKRLCTQEEWSLSCRADPAGGADTRYAYGDRLDLAICHTDRPHRLPCVPKTAQTTWETCTTDTEPSGAFPQCRSRFGVYDQHGNVAEIMTRKDADGSIKSQLKGSAWFYTELAKEPGAPLKPSDRPDAYPDHCRFDPRWHVEPIETARHVNYHLGFRCCKDL